MVINSINCCPPKRNAQNEMNFGKKTTKAPAVIAMPVPVCDSFKGSCCESASVPASEYYKLRGKFELLLQMCAMRNLSGKRS